MTQPANAAPQPPAFDGYAAWYDAFNRDKDYAGEVAYVLDKVQAGRDFPNTWLDIGCGTGKHVSCLQAHGISVEGLDMSPSMIAQARAAHPQINFYVGSAQSFQLLGRRNVISLLFHVMSYQISDVMIREALKNISAHLTPRGILVFDFWHSEAVLRHPPTTRVRETQIDGRPMFRVAHPTAVREKHLIDVRFEFRWDSATGPVVHQESHVMRHFSVSELTESLEDAGLRVVRCEAWMQDRPLASDDWYGVVCAEKQPLAP